MFAKQVGNIKVENFPNSTQRLEYKKTNFRRFSKSFYFKFTFGKNFDFVSIFS